MEKKRVNLSFDLENPQQAVVYNFLLRHEKEKSIKVTEAIMQTFMGDKYWENHLLEKEAALTEKFIEISQNRNSASLDEIRIKLNQICIDVKKLTDVISNADISPLQSSNPTGNRPFLSDAEDDDDVDDDVFSSIESMFG